MRSGGTWREKPERLHPYETEWISMRGRFWWAAIGLGQRLLFSFANTLWRRIIIIIILFLSSKHIRVSGFLENCRIRVSFRYRYTYPCNLGGHHLEPDRVPSLCRAQYHK